MQLFTGVRSFFFSAHVDDKFKVNDLWRPTDSKSVIRHVLQKYESLLYAEYKNRKTTTTENGDKC